MRKGIESKSAVWIRQSLGSIWITIPIKWVKLPSYSNIIHNKLMEKYNRDKGITTWTDFF
jgi:hypothetical protein